MISHQPSSTPCLFSISLPEFTNLSAQKQSFPAHTTSPFRLTGIRVTSTVVKIGGSHALSNLILEVERGKQLKFVNQLTDTVPATPMASSNSFFGSAPTVVLPPNHPEQHFVNGYYAADLTNGHTPNGFGNTLTPNETILPRPEALAGRKRSRSDVHGPDEEDDALGDGSIDTPVLKAPSKPRGKPMYGPGMTIIYPEDPGYEARPGSQSGTWVEEREELEQFQPGHGKRPSISTRKSKRMGSDAVAPDDLAQLVLPPQMREVTTEPLIDEATRILGISWTRMDATEALQISQAAYAKWIQNHYPSLKEVTIWFENSAIPGYLVAAQNAYSNQQEYYIFSHDLTEARLVTSDPAQLVPRLQMLPALELAAPGGCIRAETDPITAAQNQANVVQAQATPEVSDDELMRMGMLMQAGIMHGFCSAHEMDMD